MCGAVHIEGVSGRVNRIHVPSCSADGNELGDIRAGVKQVGTE